MHITEVPVLYRAAGERVNGFAVKDALRRLSRLFRARLDGKSHEHGSHAAEPGEL